MGVIPRGAVQKYGKIWLPPPGGGAVSSLRIEIDAWQAGLTPETGGLGKAVHYKNVTSTIWPQYQWNPWSERMAQGVNASKPDETGKEHWACGLVGGIDSGKSAAAVQFGLASWFADPINTSVFVISTSTIDAKKRIWAQATQRYREAKRKGIAPGRLVDSLNKIVLNQEEAEVAGIEKGASDVSSITLIAAGDKHKEEAQEKLQGIKNQTIIFVLDELQDVSDRVIREATWGFKNAQKLIVLGMGNPESTFDALGQFCEPVGGWMSIDEDSEKWKIRVAGIDGIALRFDSERSPNNDHFEKTGEILYKYLPSPKKVAEAKEELGALNPQYWRKFRGMWPPSDVDDSHIFTDLLIRKHFGNEKAYWSTDDPVIDVMGVDPAYSEGGDRFVATHGKWGKTQYGVWTFEMVHQYVLNPQNREEEDYQYNMIAQIITLRDKLGISNSNMGVDASAGGIFWSIGERGALKGWHKIAFGGPATDRYVTAQEQLRDDDGNMVVAKDIFPNRSSELAFVARYFLEAGQVRGITPPLAEELTKRKFERRGRKIWVESKREMKRRIGKSPDLYDSFAIALDVVRESFGAIAGGDAIEQKRKKESVAWKRIKERLTIKPRW